MTPDVLVGAAAATVSVVVTFVPKARGWYEARTADEKVQVVGGAVLAIVGLVVVGSCVPQLLDVLPAGWAVECSSKGIGDLARLALVGFGTNQGLYKFVLKPIEAFIAAKKVS